MNTSLELLHFFEETPRNDAEPRVPRAVAAGGRQSHARRCRRHPACTAVSFFNFFRSSCRRRSFRERSLGRHLTCSRALRQAKKERFLLRRHTHVQSRKERREKRKTLENCLLSERVVKALFSLTPPVSSFLHTRPQSSVVLHRSPVADLSAPVAHPHCLFVVFSLSPLCLSFVSLSLFKVALVLAPGGSVPPWQLLSATHKGAGKRREKREKGRRFEEKKWRQRWETLLSPQTSFPSQAAPSLPTQQVKSRILCLPFFLLPVVLPRVHLLRLRSLRVLLSVFLLVLTASLFPRGPLRLLCATVSRKRKKNKSRILGSRRNFAIAKKRTQNSDFLLFVHLLLSRLPFSLLPLLLPRFLAPLHLLLPFRFCLLCPLLLFLLRLSAGE
ncbi:hypothetical protein TGARI_372030 [Toxoplasma gondii ARI]|uniref:Transmembrane protein n=1 Tax=Toxoplasma gondii ARI TaxID=1074872 RepID=A0A139XJJ7_TOXGO|nr:hypothetical protein TGARI_372030 [Toxoplasma gondii ARI]